MLRPLLLVGVLLLLSACRGTEPQPNHEYLPESASSPDRGLARLDFLALGPGSNHLTELVWLGDVGFLGASFDGVSAVRHDGQDLTEELGFLRSESIRCTTIALHEPSTTLFCGQDEAGEFVLLDVADPAAPGVSRLSTVDDALRVSDLLVVGDVLYLARWDLGLWRADIAPDGTFAAPVPVGIDGHARKVERVGDRLVLLTQDRGLLILEDEGEGWTEAAQTPLEGPALDLALDGDRAIVALGSAGLVVVDLPSGDVSERITPPAVVTSVAMEGSILAAGSTTGVFAWDLSGGDPRLFGFVRTGSFGGPGPGTALDLSFHRGHLIVSDWAWVHRLALNPDGKILEFDAPGGVYVASDGDLRFGVRNLSGVPAEATVSFGTESVQALTLPARGVGEVVVPSEIVASQVDEGAYRDLFLEIWPEGELAPQIQFVGVVRAPSDLDPAVSGRPAPGQPFPTIAALGVDSYAPPWTVPLADRRFRVSFWTDDCAAMWAPVQDMQWLAARGELDGGAEAVFLADNLVYHLEDGANAPGMRLWGEELPYSGPYTIGGWEPLDAINGPLGADDLYGQSFVINDVPSAAAFPTDYLVGADGRVKAVTRSYRGAYPLIPTD